jgi:hypothetical protein
MLYGGQRKQSDTTYALYFMMIDSSDHIGGKTGLSPTVTVSKNGGSYAAPSGAVSEIANGLYKVAGNATDSGTLGPLFLHATATGADPCDIRFEVVNYDPFTYLPDVNVSKFGGTSVTGRDIGANVLLAASQHVIVDSGTVTTLTNVIDIWNVLLTAITTAGSIGKLLKDDIDAAISSRSTYAGGDPSGVTTLLSRIIGTLAAGTHNPQSGDTKPVADLIEDILRNKLTIDDSTGTVTLYADNNSTALYTVTGGVTDNSTITTRKRLE